MKKSKVVYIVVAVIVLLISISSVSLALWSNRFTQANKNDITSGCFNVTFTQGNEITLNNTYPISDEAGKGGAAYTVTVKNTCTIGAAIDVSFNTTTNSKLSNSYIKVYVDGDKTVEPAILNTLTVNSEKKSGYQNSYILLSDFLTPASSNGGSDGGSKTYNIRMWMDSNTPSSVYSSTPENNIFEGKVEISAVAGTGKGLASIILFKNQVKTTSPTATAFRYGEPSTTKSVSGQTYKKYEDTWTGSIASSSDMAVGSSYTFNSSTGYFALSGTTATSVSYGSGYVGYYTCGSTPIGTAASNSTSNCSSLLKIEEISGTNLTKATRITSGFSTSGSGLFSAQDDDGTSYYFRGEVDNNYVSFANKLWRVVRINGDGTIRVVLDGDTGVANNYNIYQTGNRDTHVGYTFDNMLNSSATFCTVAHPCMSYYDNSNNTFIMKQDDSLLSNRTANIKTYLENWYVSNLASYDNSISYSRYCNDTSGTLSSFGARSRPRSKT